MKKIIVLLLVLTCVFNQKAESAKLVYGEYKMFITMKKFKKDSTQFVRINIHYDGIRIARATIAPTAARCEMFTDRGKLHWENYYTPERFVFKQYFPTKEYESYIVKTKDYDSVFYYHAPGKLAYSEIRTNGNTVIKEFDEKGELIPSTDKTPMTQEEDMYAHTGIKFEDNQRKIVFRSPTRLLYVRVNNDIAVLHLQLFDFIDKTKKGLVFEREYHENGKMKKSYAITGNSEMTLFFNEKGQNIERRWKMIK